jgi:cysteine desulfurase/selenocysteine lyase
LVAHSWGSAFLQAGDEIILTEMEHHANIVPWQLIAQKTGALIRSVPITKEGTLDLTALPSLLNDRTKIVAFVHISNALGTVNPVDTIIKQVRDFNPEIKILIDGTQAVVHQKIDVTVMDVDFYAFTGHKLYAATGIGVLYGKEDLLNSMPPYQGGGDMIETVRMDSSDFKKAPARFEAGTPPFIEAISLHHALDYLDTIGMDSIMAHEKDILSYGYTRLKNIHGLTIHGTVDLQQRAAILPFTIDWAHPSDVAMILDQCGVAVRVGHHCCQPLMAAMGVSATLRVSLGLYNTTNDIDILIQSIHKAKEMLG